MPPKPRNLALSNIDSATVAMVIRTGVGRALKSVMLPFGTFGLFGLGFECLLWVKSLGSRLITCYRNLKPSWLEALELPKTKIIDQNMAKEHSLLFLHSAVDKSNQVTHRLEVRRVE